MYNIFSINQDSSVRHGLLEAKSKILQERNLKEIKLN